MNIIINTIKPSRTKKTTIFTIERLCALYVVLWIFVPPVQVGSLYRVAAIACAALWFLLVALQNENKVTDLWKFFRICIPCIILMSIHGFPIFGFPGSITRCLQYIIMSICALIGIYYSKNDSNFLKTLICVAMIFMAIFSITTIQGLIEDPYASRIANSEWLEDRFQGNENVGLYGFVYMSVMTAPLLLYKIIKRITFGKFFDFLSVILFMLFAVMTIFSGYMIANFCFVLGCAFILLFNTRRHLSVKVAFVIVVGLIFFFLYENILSAIFSWLMKIFEDNPAYYAKLIDFRALFLSGDASGSTVSGRFSNYWSSIRNAINYPIIGSYLFGKSGGGGHSSVFDMIGRYGWLAAFLFFKTLWHVPYQIYHAKHAPISLNAWLIVVILFGIFDPYAQEVCIPLFLFLPYMLQCADACYEDRFYQKSTKKNG